jgi:probable rRNA maturation factor
MNTMSQPPVASDVTGEEGEPPSRRAEPADPARRVPTDAHPATPAQHTPSVRRSARRCEAPTLTDDARAVSIELDDQTGRLCADEHDEVRRLAVAGVGDVVVAVAPVDASRADAVADVAGVSHSDGGEVRVRIVDDDEMAAAHTRYMGVAGTTDVITFDAASGGAASGEPLDADLLVCLDEATRQAASRGHARAHELVLYILHGVLHCLGYDDRDESAFERMHAEEDRLLRGIGLGPIFHDGGGVHGSGVSRRESGDAAAGGERC